MFVLAVRARLYLPAASGHSALDFTSWHSCHFLCHLQDHQVARFTSENKEQFGGVSGVTITTFTMVAFSGRRSDESEKVGSTQYTLCCRMQQNRVGPLRAWMKAQKIHECLHANKKAACE